MTPTASLQPNRASWVSLIVILAAVLGTSHAWSWWQEARAVRTLQAQAHRGSITLYTTSDCPYCARARAWLNAHGIPWAECNVELDQACKQTYESHGAPGVPLVRANGQWRLGFDPVWVSEAL
jgi:glutaredoxin